ncbi:MAG: glycosyltransferase family 2 protein [Pseudomonadota bacterium]
MSVVLPVYNGPRYVRLAIDSMLAQSFRDFELIVIDDGSRDTTPEVLSQIGDPRVRVITQENRGLPATLNRGIELARGEYVARQDHDDYSRPERLARQVAYLDAHPACALVGTWAEIIEGATATGRVHAHPCENVALKLELLFDNPFVHSSVMLRRAVVTAGGGYCTDRDRQPPEDYELWSRIVRKHEVANLPEMLHTYREVPGSMSRLGPAPFRTRLVRLAAENLAWWSGRSAGHPQAINAAALYHRDRDALVGKPDFSEMRAIITDAVERIVGNAPGVDIEDEVRRRAATLRRRHLEMRFARGPAGVAVEWLRTVRSRLPRSRRAG